MKRLIDRARLLETYPRVEDPDADFSSAGLSPERRARLHLNENPAPFPADVADAIRAAIDPAAFRTYFDPFCLRLQEALAGFTGFSSDCLAIGNGGDDLIHTLLYLAASSGADAAVTLDPSYYYYTPAISCHGLGHLRVPLDRDLNFDPDLFIDLANGGGGGRIAFLCNPNNPTGHLLPGEAIGRIISGVKDDSLLVIDEAYFDYSGVSSAKDAVGRPNVLVLRTMSKMFSFAGVHFGWLIGNPELVRAIDAIRNPYTVNCLTQTAAAVTLEQRDRFSAHRDELITTRDWFAAKVQDLGFRVYPSATNFVLLGPAPAPALVSVHGALEAAGFLTRPLSGNFAGCTRITIGSRAVMARVVEVLAETIGGGRE